MKMKLLINIILKKNPGIKFIKEKETKKNNSEF